MIVFGTNGRISSAGLSWLDEVLPTLALLAQLAPLPALAGDTVDDFAFTVDGDTIEIQDQRIRLWGIDAPEIAQRCTEAGRSYPCGLDASQALRKRNGRRLVNCIRRDTDRYGRMVAVCRQDGVDLSQWMVQQGQAVAFRKYSLDYVTDEERARMAKAGLWAGEFQDPSAYRHRPRLGKAEARGGHRACACPDDTDRAGRRCGRRSAHARPGGADYVCAAR